MVEPILFLSGMVYKFSILNFLLGILIACNTHQGNCLNTPQLPALGLVSKAVHMTSPMVNFMCQLNWVMCQTLFWVFL